MHTKEVFLLLNGEKPIEIPDTSDYQLICATDGAYTYLKQHQITPHLISGDFDSTTVFPENTEIIHTPNQDFTDFDKILQILFERNYKHIHVFGASGNEQDHFLGNLHTAIQWKKKLKITFFDNYGYYFLADENTQITTQKGNIVSLIPFPIATHVTTKGLQYPLNNESLTFGTRIGTRNKAVNSKISIGFDSGELFIFVNHQKHLF